VLKDQQDHKGLKVTWGLRDQLDHKELRDQ
jgi:hypothetical protein